MAIDVNGYNDAFKAFADFAAKSVNAGDSKAVARAPADVATGALAGREIKAATTDSVRHMFKWFRASDDQKANDATRTIFKNAIIDMFGGESKIPESVKKAMIMADYDCGKPLTARRILAVKVAIDASGTTEARIRNLKLATFQSPEVEAAALAKGYSKGELPKLAKAVNLYAQTTGCSEAEALEAVSTPNSKPNRLMNYGGRFLQSADNFKNGLRLIDSFDSWYAATCAAMDKIHAQRESKYESGMSLTLLNGRGDDFDLRYKLGTEKFVFEELAFNSSINLAEENPEQVFGMENNAAMRAVGRDFHSSRTQTFTQIPPEKRPIFLKALDTLCPLFASDAEKARIRLDERPGIKSKDYGFLTARILKNFDKIAGMERSGKLTAANLAKLCFPEIKNPGSDPIKSVNKLFDRWHAERYGDTDEEGYWINPKYPTKLAGTMQNIMEATGCTIEEAFEVANGSKMPSANVQYYSPGSMSIESLDGTTNIARREVQGDIYRPDNYTYKDGKPLLAETAFRFNLPGGESIATNATPEGKANVAKVMDKLEALCGKMHVQQASNLLMMISQSGLSALRGGLSCHGILSSEHSSVDFTISKNEETGDVTIRYSAPKELPFHFEWTATIQPDGYVSTTPLSFVEAEKLRSAVDEFVANVQKPDAPMAAKLQANKADPVAIMDNMIRATCGDRDVISLLKDEATCSKLLFDSFDKLRPASVVQARVAALRENVAELREATKGNPLMFKMGLERIKSFGGKPIPKGMLSTLVKAVNAEKIEPFNGNLNDLDGLPEIFDDVRDITKTLHADLIERERRDLGE